MSISTTADLAAVASQLEGIAVAPTLGATAPLGLLLSSPACETPHDRQRGRVAGGR